MQRDDSRDLHISESDIADAVRTANVPALLPMLVQHTGDQSWIEAPYSPARPGGLGEDDTGGLSDAVQDTVRKAAVDAIWSWHNGRLPAIPVPRGAILLRMMSATVGEEVPPEYQAMTASDLGFTSLTCQDKPVESSSLREEAPSVIILGAGISGLTLARDLQQQNIPFTIFEKNTDVGGAWHENRYPGCGVDTPSHLYSWSDYPNDWSQHFAKRDEVYEYIRSMANDHGLREQIHFGHEVVKAEFNTSTSNWSVRVKKDDGSILCQSAAVLVTAVGQLNRPHVPQIYGIDSFNGRAFHSANWPTDIAVDDQRVALVGTGASAMQIAPSIAPHVRNLTIFQRSPQWIAPSGNYFRELTPGERWLIREAPFYQKWYRFWLSWIFGDRIHASLQIDPSWDGQGQSINESNERHRQHFLRFIESEVSSRPDLIDKVTPNYPPFGKRMLLDNGWFQTLRRRNVRLIDEAVTGIRGSEIVSSSGLSTEADIVIFATGFEAKKMLYPISVVGRDGYTIRSEWGHENPQAYLGMAAPGFPNFFVMYGPNTNLGHGGSYIKVAECQSGYLTDLIGKMIKDDIRSVEVKQEVHDQYIADVDAAHAGMVWSHPGMETWYRNSSGRVVTNMPWRIVDYWRLTRVSCLDDYLTS